MRIVTWNCNGAFRNKFREIVKYNADIYVIQECENPEYTSGEYHEWANNYLWVGDIKHKGLGVFAKASIKIQRLNWEDNGLQLFLPINVNNQFNIVGVWTKYANSPTFRYIGQLWKYLQLHKDKMSATHTILCGDLNSNKKWDVWDRWWNHSDVVSELKDIHMVSLYHSITGELQGDETIPTLFLQRNQQKRYHIDYCFAHEAWVGIVKKLEIGDYCDWCNISDHSPLIVDFDM